MPETTGREIVEQAFRGLVSESLGATVAAAIDQALATAHARGVAQGREEAAKLCEERARWRRQTTGGFRLAERDDFAADEAETCAAEIRTPPTTPEGP